ncbi:MAG: response regulator transcription factor [Planctomycetes bacterium]|nr:response regulator transcription factor [Planctomycetota bacterium]
MRLLLVEDDRPLRDALGDRLRAAGWAVDEAADGDDGLRWARHARYDAIVLDVNLPGRDGFSVLSEARRAGCAAPVLLLTARDGVDDRVRGLDLGADDYLVKPFATVELLARLRALTRRSGRHPAADALEVGDLVFDPRTRVARRGGERLDLTPKETAILEALLRAEGGLVTRAMLFDTAWDASLDAFPAVLDVHISNLRRKLEAGGRPRLLHTVRGQGFVLAERAP